MKYALFFFLTISMILFVFSSCSEDNTTNSTNVTEQLIPAKTGNYWIYMDSTFYLGKTQYDTLTGRIVATKLDTVNGKALTIYTQCEYNKSGEKTKQIFISNESDGLYVYGGDKDTNNLLYSNIIAKYPTYSGYQWTCNYFVYLYADSAFHNYTSHATVVNPNDTFTTPLGIFNCISFKFQTEYGETTEYYKPGIGYLGYYDTYDGKFAGKRMLIEFKLF